MLLNSFSNQVRPTIIGHLKRLVMVVTLLCVASLTMSAEKYMIVDMSSASIKIGGKTLKTGNVFNDDAIITWATNPQWITVKSISNGRISKLSRKQFESKSTVKTLKDFYLRSAKASTRGSAGYSLNFIESDNKAKFPERRIALIIGNSDYSFMDKLKNPVNDASDVTDKLLDLGFDVLVLYNGSWQEMQNALQEFTDMAVNYKAAVFYYSGHGTQYSSKSYLVPLGNSMQSEVALEKCISCNDVLNNLDNTRCDTRIAFFDACRTVPSWNSKMSQEVSSVEAKPGTVIFFSTRSGRVAQDGDGRNSPFANALISNIGKPFAFIELEDRLVKDTYNKTQQYQFPIHSGTLLTDFKFNPNSGSNTNTTTTSNTGSNNNSGQATRSQQQQPTHVVAPNGKEPSISVGTGDFSVRTSYFKRNGDKATIDLYITNKTEGMLEMCVHFDTEAFADNGATFGWNYGKIRVYKNSHEIGGSTFSCPSGVPVKITLEINNASSTIKYFPLINLVLRYKSQYGSWTNTTVKIKNWVFESAAAAQPQLIEPAGNIESAITLSTSDFNVRGYYLKRSGDDMITWLDITNRTEDMIEMCVHFDTEAFADNGATFGWNYGKIRVYKNSQEIGGSTFSCPPDVPVKIALKISGVASTIKYFPLINVILRYKSLNNNWANATCRLINWTQQAN